jgi:hypothetical protein
MEEEHLQLAVVEGSHREEVEVVVAVLLQMRSMMGVVVEEELPLCLR